MDSKSLSHTKWKCQYHIVFIPKPELFFKILLYLINVGFTPGQIGFTVEHLSIMIV